MFQLLSHKHIFVHVPIFFSMLFVFISQSSDYWYVEVVYQGM